MSDLWAADVFVGLNDTAALLRALVRLTVAAALGAVVGMERQTEGKPTSARMHMIVALGAAVAALAISESGNADALARVIQGVMSGVGFLGAGAIMKDGSEQRVHGLTTAASVWLTAAIGVAVGSGHLWIGVLGVLLGWVVLTGLKAIHLPRGDFTPMTQEEEKKS